MPPPNKKEIKILFRYNELPGKVLNIWCNSMWTTEKTDITKMWMDKEQHMPKSLWQDQEHIKKNAAMVLYNEKEQLYWEQMMHRMEFPKNEAPDSAVLWPIDFGSRRLTSSETHYSNMEKC